MRALARPALREKSLVDTRPRAKARFVKQAVPLSRDGARVGGLVLQGAKSHGFAKAADGKAGLEYARPGKEKIRRGRGLSDWALEWVPGAKEGSRPLLYPPSLGGREILLLSHNCRTVLVDISLRTWQGSHQAKCI